MTTLESVRIEGLRSLRVIELEDLGPVTVLIGANGAGKSNLLLALRFLSYIASQSLGSLVLRDLGGANSVLYRGSKRTPSMSLEARFRGDAGPVGYRVVLSAAVGDKLIISEESVASVGPDGTAAWRIIGVDRAESALDEASEPVARVVRFLLQRCKHLHVHDTSVSSRLRGLSREAESRYLRSDGSNLAAYLHALQHDESVTGRAARLRIRELVQQVAPFVKELTPTRVTGAAGMIRLDWVDEQDDFYSVEHLSDGTLRAIALITMLAQPADRLPRLLVIDEPELGLHPSALSLICELARSAASSGCQVILATQAPAVLDHVEAQEVVVLEREDGATAVHRLDPASLEEWRGEYSLADLWKKNVLGGRP